MEGSAFTHVDASGKVRMVDVGDKAVTDRFARATARVIMQPATACLIVAGGVAKGDVITVARMAGIMGAKRTDELIPLAHQVPLSAVSVDVAVDEVAGAVDISASARTQYRTGVEMEAMVACSIAALTVYDMIKGIDRRAHIEHVRVVEKRGGRSGDVVLDPAGALGESHPT